MASSRSSTRADPVERAVAAWLATPLASRGTIAFALSGGRDSMALLDAGAAALRARGRDAIAFHVHHGLQAGADGWAAHCARECAARGLAYAESRVSVATLPRTSVEATARDARYAALRALARDHGVSAIALAHHQDDQAETLLLQLGRGAGPAGLAAMPAEHVDPDGVAWCRPLLGVTRAEIAAYASARNLRYVDDPSNGDARWRRNAVRSVVSPAWSAVLPGYPATVARAAEHQADAAALLDALAERDAQDAGYDAASRTLAAASLAAIGDARARNLLRWFLRRHGLASPPAARLRAMVDQLAHARDDATVAIAHAGAIVGRHRGRVAVHAPAPPDYVATWRGEAALTLPHGELRFDDVDGGGVDLARIGGGLSVRPRRGGERLQLAADRTRRALKSILRESSLPTWERDALPLIVAGDVLVAVPGIGVDVAWQAGPGRPGRWPVWSARA
jgi:tRNA(Ile)-lysidine synthase